VFHFSHNSAFYLLVLIPICIIIYIVLGRWQFLQIKKLGNYHLITNLIKSVSASWKKVQIIFFLLGISLLIVCLADPSSAGIQQSTQSNSKEIVFALDLSNSMNAMDVVPSRLSKAKQFIQNIINRNTLDKFGLVVFAGNAYISVPITVDIETIKMNLASIETSMLPTQGTNLKEAILRAYDCFNIKREGGKVIILVTDGEDHEEGIEEAIAICNKNNVNIVSVGVGSNDGSKIIDVATNQPKVDEQGNVVISKLNAEELEKIAKDANGAYIQLQNTDAAAAELVDKLNSIASEGSAVDTNIVYQHYYQYLLLPAIFLLGIALFFHPQKNKNRP
jgi:Ca-activated chloride channel family protein